MRAPAQLSYVVDNLLEVPPVLRYLQQLANMSDEEAYGTFNMGVGYVCFVGAQDAQRAHQVALDAGHRLGRIGHVKKGPRSVSILPLGIQFADSSLQIR